MSETPPHKAMVMPPGKKPADDEEDLSPRKELPYAFEKELIENSNRHWCGKHAFVPSGKRISQPIAAKFYARHEQNTLDYEKFLQCTSLTHASDKRLQRGFPLLESQVYGWQMPGLTPEMVAEVKQLNFICAPKLRTGMTIHGEKVISERVTERPPFNGLRFIV